MEEMDPAEDYRSPAAAKLMDVAFGLNGMARYIAAEAKTEEARYVARLKKEAQRRDAEARERERERDRLRKQRARDNARLLAQARGGELPAATGEPA